MIGIRFTKTASAILIGAIVMCCITASGVASAVPSLQQYFQALVQHYDPSSLPKYEDLLKVTDQIATARAEDVAVALPAIFLTLAHQDDNLKIDAAFALTVISRRVDSAQLLGKYVAKLSGLFDSSDSRLQSTPPLIFLNLKPPPSEVLEPVLSFVKRTDRDPQAQGSAIFTLIRLAPNEREVAAVVQEFLSRQLDISTRIGVLNALGTPNVRDVGIIEAVITSISDPDQGIRLAAIQTLMRMGQSALQQAEPTLQRLANDPTQPANVVADAKAVLEKLHPRDNK